MVDISDTPQVQEICLPYARHSLDEDDLAAVMEALRSDWITQGPMVERFENALCERFNAKYAVAVSSGTAALHLACLALEVGPGDEVVTTPNTFVASANCVLYCGGRVRFVDTDERTYNLSADRLEELLDEPKARKHLKGIIPVHFAGQPCEMERIHALAGQHGLWVIEDACHASGARWQDSSGDWHSVGACTHSDVAVFSFHPAKHFTTGEGGAILTNRQDVYKELLRLRTHGITKDPAQMTENHGPWYYQMLDLGFNYRITDFQCALGLSQIRHLDRWLQRRREIAQEYSAALAEVEEITTPYVSPDVEHAYHLYVVQVPNRKLVFERLRAYGIGTQVHYIPVHIQPYYRQHLGYKPGDFPNAEAYYWRAISLPLFPEMTEADVRHVIQAIKRAIREVESVSPT